MEDRAQRVHGDLSAQEVQRHLRARHVDTTRLCTGRAASAGWLAYTRIATPNTAGAANWLQSCSSVAPIAELCSFGGRTLAAAMA